jgi:hypothetical protein
MSDNASDNDLHGLIDDLATQLSRTQSELEQLRERVQVRPPRSSKRWLLPAGVAIALSLVVGTRLVVANAPPNTGEVVPRQIPYRGYLEKDGAPYTGQLELTFELYPDPTSTSALWSETRSVEFVTGAFNVDLGDCTSATSCPKGNLSSAIGTSTPSLYLSMKVAGNALAGRQRLLSTPYAQNAAWASSASSATTAANAQRGTPGLEFLADSLRVSGATTLLGSVNGASGSFTGSVNGASGSFTGSVTAGSISAGNVSAANLAVGGTVQLVGDLQTSGNTRSGCSWTNVDSAITGGDSEPFTCPEGKFVAGIQIRNSPGSNQSVDMINVYCCNL